MTTTTAQPTGTATLGRKMLNKVPEVTIFFWVIKIMCTTVGETAADFLNTNLNLGLTGTTYVIAAVLAVSLLLLLYTWRLFFRLSGDFAEEL